MEAPSSRSNFREITDLERTKSMDFSSGVAGVGASALRVPKHRQFPPAPPDPLRAVACNPRLRRERAGTRR